MQLHKLQFSFYKNCIYLGHGLIFASALGFHLLDSYFQLEIEGFLSFLLSEMEGATLPLWGEVPEVTPIALDASAEWEVELEAPQNIEKIREEKKTNQEAAMMKKAVVLRCGKEQESRRQAC